MTECGVVALIGSGETAASGGQAFEALAQELPVPLKASVLETPAGFEGNSARVAGRVADFLRQRLQNYQPQVDVIAARKKDTPYSPNRPEIVRPLYSSDLIFLGPGSPTYAVRQLKDSLAWQIVQARHRLGAGLALASAASIAAGALALPVYEIYKVGEDPNWKPGLDLFGPFGLSLVIVPHWNNRDGGDDLDTSRCFIGQERFAVLQEQLPGECTLLGIDEHTSLTIAFERRACRVAGQGQVHLLHCGEQRDYGAEEAFPIQALGDFHPLPAPEIGLPQAVWETARSISRSTVPSQPEVPEEVRRLVDQRQDARRAKEWARADELRRRIARLGWSVEDTASGPLLTRIE
jgi:hypothetical protein